MNRLKFASVRIAFAFLLLALGFGSAASAATAEFQILLDLDESQATGCEVPTVLPGQPFQGVEQILTTTVTTTGGAAEVTAVTIQTCDAPPSHFGMAVAVTPPAGHPLPWPVGPSNGTGGTSVIETFYPLDLSPVANPRGVRLAVLGFNNSGVLTDDLQGARLQLGSVIDVPTLSEWGLILLGGLLAMAAIALLRRRTATAFLVALLFLGMAGVAWAAACDLNGNTIGEWGEDLNSETTPDAPAGADIRAFFGFRDDGSDGLCFRVDAHLLFNTAPVAVTDSYSTPQGMVLNVPAPGVLSNDQGGDLTVTPQAAAPTAQGGTVTLNADGSFIYTPPAGFVSPPIDSFTYTVNNPLGSANGTVELTSVDVNEAPSFLKGLDQTVLEDAGVQVVNGWATAISPGPPSESGQSVMFLVTANTNPGLFSSGPTVSPSGVLTYVPAPNANGSAAVTLVLQDSGGTANGGQDTSGPQTFNINVTAVNDAPSFLKGPDQTALENAGPQTVNPWASAISRGPADESGQTVAFQVTNNTNPGLFSAGPMISPTGVLTYTPATNTFGTATITLDLMDSGGTANGGMDTSAPQTFTITVSNVNQAPSFTRGPDATVLEDAGAQTVSPWATAISAGPGEGSQTVTFQITNNTNAALFSAGPAVSSTGDLTFTPAPNANGTATITLVAKDDGGTANGGVDTSAPQTFDITVTAVNDAPSFLKGADQTVLENAGPQTVNPWATSISPGPTDESGQTLTFNVTGNTNPSLFSAGPAVSPAGALTFTPATNTFGTATITLTLQDNGGTANSGMDTSAPQTFTITVDNVNQAPSFTKGPDQTVLEDAGPQTVSPWATAISPGPGEGSQTVTFQVTNNTNAALFSAGPAVSPTGVLTFTPAPNANGTATITLVLKDDGGTANGGVDTSAPQTFDITVTAVNDVPSFTKGPDVTVLENSGPHTSNPWATAISAGPADESSQTLTFNVTGNTNPSLFSAGPSVSPAGVLTFTPATNAFGTATISLTLLDNGGTANGGVDTSAPQTFTITVDNVNQAPSFTKGPNQTVLEDAGAQTVSPWATAISPGAGEGSQTVAFSVTGNTNPSLFSAGPSVSPTGVLTFTPAPNAFGTATLTIILQDNGGTANGGVDTSAPQTFDITVTPVNDIPSFLKGPDVTVLEDSGAQTVNPWATAVSPGPANESSQTVVFSVTGNTNAGLFSAGPLVSPAGVLTFTPAPNAFGTATVTITLQDNGGTANGGLNTSGPQSFDITVTPINDVPSFTKGPDVTVLENSGAHTSNPWATAISPGPANESVQTVAFNVTNNTNPSLFSAGPSVSPTGALTFTPAPNVFGTATITIVLQDSGGTTNGGVDTSPAQTFDITVTQVNQAPSFTKGPDETVLEDSGPQTFSPWATAISPGPPSESSQTVTFNITGNTNPGLFSAGPSVSPTGVLTFTPASNAFGTAAITLVLQDNGGTANGGMDTSAPQTFNITVTSVNDAPFFTQGPNQNVFDNAGPITVNPWATAISAGAANESGQTLAFSITGNDHPEYFAAGPSVSPTGVLTFTPAIVPVGTHTATITIVLQDNGGTANGGADTSVTHTFMISITHVNIPPSLTNNPISYSTPGNTQLHVAGASLAGVTFWADPQSISAKALPTDSDGPGALTVVPAAGTTANGGTYSITMNGAFTYVPAAGFTGMDTIPYQVTDTQDMTNGAINVTVGPRVWYIRDVVDANNAAGGDGRSTNAFDTIAAFNAATTLDGDIIFIFTGNTVTTPLAGGITLRNGQKLWGQGIDLNVPGFGTPLVNVAANKPRINNAGGDAVSVPATGAAQNRQNVEIRGLDLQGSSNAVDVTASGANNVSITISTNDVRGAGLEGIDLNAGSTGTFAATLNNNALAATGNAFDARTSAGSGTLTIDFSNEAVVSNATGVLIDGSVGGGTRIIGFANNAVSGNNVGTGISITSATFDVTPGAPYDPIPVSGGATVVGASGNGVGGSGIVLSNVAGDLAFTDLDIFAEGGAALRVTGTGAVNTMAGTGTRVAVGAGGSPIATFEATGGPAVDMTNATIDLQITALKSTNSPTTGVSLVNVADGTTNAIFSAGVLVAGSSITNATGTDFNVDGGNATISYGGSINNTAGRSVSVTNRTGDSVTFTNTSTINDTGTGIQVATNAAGAVTDFLGALTLSTGTNAAFAASSGGTLRVMGAANTIATTTGVALNVTSTTIGAGSGAPETGLRFQSISANGGANGIVLSTTGASGSLTVTGSGSAGTGGTIRNMVGADGATAGNGIFLNSTNNPSLNWMQLNDFQNFAIRGTTVAGFSLSNSTINGTNGNNASAPFNEGSASFTNLTGSATVSNTNISGGFADNFRVVNMAGTLNRITFSSVTIGANSTANGNDGITLEAQSTATLNATVQNSTFTSARGDLFQLNMLGTSSSDLVFTGNTLSNNHPGIATGGGGVTISGGDNTGSGVTLTFNIANNTFRDADGHGILIVKSTDPGTFNGTFTNNTIGVAAVADSGSKAGSGIKLQNAGLGTVTASITNNQIRQYNNFGIELLTGGGATALSGNLFTTITGNTVSNPGTGGLPMNGIHLNGGTVPGDTYQICTKVGGAGALANSITGSGANGGTDFRLRQRQSTTVRLPGYGGANNNDAAVISFVQGNNGGASGLASNTVPTGGGFVGGGSTCP